VKFRVGDKVRVVNSSPEAVLRGKSGTLKRVETTGICRIFFRRLGEYDVPASHLEKI
jgi:hypothetical protein